MRALLIAAVAVAVSSTAFAKDLKGSVMTDSEMDKVTAGFGFVEVGGFQITNNGQVNRDTPGQAFIGNPEIRPVDNGFNGAADQAAAAARVPH